MARPKTYRRVGAMPFCSYFKPQGISLDRLEEVDLTVDEMEAIKLADLEGLYQEEAAERMGVSRQTFGRIVEAARKKVAEALVKGKALKIAGGEVTMADRNQVECPGCHFSWELPKGEGKPKRCPYCHYPEDSEAND